MREALDHTLELLENSFVDTSRYGFTNEFYLVANDSGKYQYLYRNLNGVPYKEITEIKELGTVDPVLPALTGKKWLDDLYGCQWKDLSGRV